MKKIIYIGIAALLVALIVWKLMLNKKEIDKSNALPAKKEVFVAVNAYQVKMENRETPLEKVGVLQPIKEADISAMSPGKLTQVRFALGSYVAKGQVLASVDNESLRLSLAQAELLKNKLQKDVQRVKTLVEGNAATQVNLDDLVLQLDNAKAQISILKRQMSDATLKAPISGIVTTKLKEEGEYVAPGVSLGHIVDIATLKAAIMVEEQEVYALKVGNTVNITTSVYPEQRFVGRISFISPKGDDAHNYLVEVELSNSNAYPLKAGTFINASFPRKNLHSMIVVPRTAFISGLKNPQVYVVENSKAVVREVVVGKEFGSWVEIKSGVQPSEWIVTSGLINLTNGATVRIIK